MFRAVAVRATRGGRRTSLGHQNIGAPLAEGDKDLMRTTLF